MLGINMDLGAHGSKKPWLYIARPGAAPNSPALFDGLASVEERFKSRLGFASHGGRRFAVSRLNDVRACILQPIERMADLVPEDQVGLSTPVDGSGDAVTNRDLQLPRRTPGAILARNSFQIEVGRNLASGLRDCANWGFGPYYVFN